MSIAELSSAGSLQEIAAPQKAPQAPARPSEQAPRVDTRNYRTVDPTAALVKDEYDVTSSSNASVSSEEAETEGISVYA